MDCSATAIERDETKFAVPIACLHESKACFDTLAVGHKLSPCSRLLLDGNRQVAPLPCPVFSFEINDQNALFDSRICIPTSRFKCAKQLSSLRSRTMGQIGTMIADAASVSQRYAKRLLVGVPVDRFARFAAPGGQTIESNHPAFVLGHLSLYPLNVVRLLGQDTSSVQPSERFAKLFSKDAKCQDDIHGILYPSMNEIVDTFTKNYETAITVVRDATDAQLIADNPSDSPLKQLCPTLGAMLNFYLTSHVAMHLGQFSTWRRMEGLPPA